MKKCRTILAAYYVLNVVQCLLLLTASHETYAQPSQNWTSAEIHLALRKLNVLGSVLYVAAHPDDENTRLITYFSKDKLYRTGYLSVTRGDGGQNLIGDEQGIELGLIRTQELLAARRIDGGEQFFTRAFDFGYSKNPEETFSKWHKEKILSDVVWVIRKFQPDVIINRFPTTGEGGHGHHTGSAILANEAFTAAADPNRFPEQLKYLQPWQAKRILWNTFNFGGNNTITPDQFKIDVGGYNALLGKSYGEIAAESRSQHKSQGFGVPASRGESFESFKATGGSPPEIDLMDDVNLGWKRVAGGEKIEMLVNELVSSFDLSHPEKSVGGLVNLYKTVSSLPDGYWKTQKLREVKTLIERCSGLFIDATTTEQFAVQTDSIRINFSFNNRLGTDAVLQKVTLDEFDTTFSRPLEKNKNFNFSKTFFIPSTKPLTQPYWLTDKMEEGYFQVSNMLKIGQPDLDAAYLINVYIKIKGQDFWFTTPVKYKYTDPVKGEVYWPVSVVPSYSLKISPELDILSGKPELKYDMVFSSYKNNNQILSNRTPGHVEIDSFLLRKGETRTVPYFSGADDQAPVDSKNSKTALPANSNFADEYQFQDRVTSQELFEVNIIKYDHIPSITYFKKSRVIVKNFDLKTHHKKIGYIIGAGDKVPEALDQMGYEVSLLTEKELSRNNLKQFDAIISGIRAYNTNEWLNKYYDKLMKYVNEGGNYIVQYNTSNFISTIRTKVGPYNFDISRTRITDEHSPVNFLKPDHPVLNFPNKITNDDFKGWVQERSIYHAGARDSANFESVISLNDPGEKSEDGSLIIAKYGKGYFTYTGLVFFRQLPAGVPGAYRLLANLIALNRKKAF